MTGPSLPPSAPAARSAVPNAILLTSHPRPPGGRFAPVRWGATDPQQRGPIIATLHDAEARNAIGSHAGAYAVYRALAIAAGSLPPVHRPDLTNTVPADDDRPFPQWASRERIVSLDPWGHLIAEVFADQIAAGVRHPADHRGHQARASTCRKSPSADAPPAGFCPTATCCTRTATCAVTKAAIEPVWYLPGIAERFGISETDLRRSAVRADRRHVPRAGDAAGPRRVPAADRRHDGLPVRRRRANSADPETQASPAASMTSATARTCSAPTSAPAAPIWRMASRSASRRHSSGGVGVIVYNRKEGRALGEVTKFLVYNARKRQDGGDRAEAYFQRTECVAGVSDMRFQELMPDVLHWLGIASHRSPGVDEQYEVRRRSSPAASRSSSACRSRTN